MPASLSPSPDTDERVSIGSVLDGRYRIDGILGSGGMGRVYRGEHTGIGRAVAIKVLHADLNRNREAAQRFQREAIASGRLDHPNIVGVSDFGVLDDGAFFLVMEALEGESLGDRLERDRYLPWREAVDIMRGVMQGLRHAHERGVVHRDIKPDNIFLARKDGELVVKILDFGIAKLRAGGADDPASTRAGLTVGTPAYLSPEQAVGGEITPASDIYSSTVVLFEMLAGRTPFENKDPLAMLGAHVSQQPPRLADIAPGVELPPGIEDVIQRGLVKVAAERIPSASDYLVWLDAIVAAMPVGSAPVIVPPSDLGSMSTSMLPLSGEHVVPHMLTPVPGMMTPAPFPSQVGVANSMMMTPMPTPHSGSVVVPSAPSGTAPTESLASMARPDTRAGSLAEASDPIPRRWFTIGGIVLGCLILIAVIATVSGDDPKPAVHPDKAKVVDPKLGKPEPTKPDVKQPVQTSGSSEAPKPPDLTVGNPEIQLKAALHDLVNGKTCADRKAAIPRLLALRDPRAIPALKSARYRMRGGVLGIGDENTNSCLTRDAEAAIKTLTPPKSPKKKR
jgi:serine/threonine protein kinase